MVNILPCVLLILTHLLGIDSFGGRNHEKVKSTCTKRFEFRNHTHPTCSGVIKSNPTCGRNISIAYSVLPPYVILKNGSVVGILPDMIRYALHSCCFKCSSVHFIGPYSYKDKFHQNSSLVIPIQTSVSTEEYFGHDYIYMFEVKYVSFIGPLPKQDPNEMIGIILKAGISTWPILLTALFMAIMAGVAIWVLENECNSENFPKSFLQGPLAGFWFAMVSMTTVGYGDRIPKSVCGRLFAMFWIVCGVAIFSMFTAALTSSMTAAEIDAQSNLLYKKNFAVLNTTSAGIIATMKQSASHTIFGSIEEIKKAIEKEEVDGVALDENIGNYHFSHKEEGKNKLELLGRIPTTKSSYGMLSLDDNITTLFRSFFKSNDDQRDIMAMKAMTEDHPHMFENSLEMHKKVFEIYFSPRMLSATIATLFLASVLLLVAGAVLRRLRSIESEKKVSVVNLYPPENPNILTAFRRLPEEPEFAI